MLADKAIDAAAFCRDWRNRRIAHCDLALALDSPSPPLEPASREKVSLALQSLSDVLNEVTLHYSGSTTLFDSPVHNSDLHSLLSIIKDGLQDD